MSDTTRNQSLGVAAATTTRFYLSTNGAVDAGDTLLGTRAVPALAGATNDSGATTLTIPPGTAPGTYYLLGVADGDAAQAEIVETNNLTWRVFQVSP